MLFSHAFLRSWFDILEEYAYILSPTYPELQHDLQRRSLENREDRKRDVYNLQSGCRDPENNNPVSTKCQFHYQNTSDPIRYLEIEENNGIIMRTHIRKYSLMYFSRIHVI